MKKIGPGDTRYVGALSLLGLIAVCFFSKTFLESKLASFNSRKPSLEPLGAHYRAESLKRFVLGFDNLAADLLWVELLQRASHAKVRSDQVSWEFAQTDAVTTLDPNFERAFSFGAVYLSSLREDRQGAKLLLQKWIKRNPYSWQAHYTMGCLLYYDLHDYEAAAPHILKAAGMQGAPFWLSSLGIRLLSEAGAVAQALRSSMELFDTVNSVWAKERLRDRIRSLNFAVQRSAWERALTLYREKKGREPADLFALKPLLAEAGRQIASIPFGDQVSEELRQLLKEDFGFYFDRASRRIRADEKLERTLGKLGIFKPAKGAGK